ncbi:FUSC family protein [Halobacillus litoralis]|uniref:FUSC family protein n=1 Tax=Halobacillus litoralis TaxID=45668 RepID=UPI001CD31E1D|nr:FUSC family protein [Halobacillus litoralis]MCA0969231.1 FUSC family protein [Halobacillus litoralis]
MTTFRMKQPYVIRRLLASDPGRKRLLQSGKATLSLITSVFLSQLILNALDQPALLPSIISGMAGMMGIMIVMDDTKEKKKVTTGLLGVSAVGGVTAGSLLASQAVLVSILMVLVIFSSFYFSRFGSRYFSLGMIGFFTVYFSSFLKLSPEQFPWFYVTIFIGIGCAYLYNFILFRDSAQTLKRSMNSFHKQANLTFQLLIEIIEDAEYKASRHRTLLYNVKKLREYANHVSTDLNANDIREIWPGLSPRQLKLYVFDTSMLVATLSDNLTRLKDVNAFEMKEIQSILVKLITILQQAEVLHSNYEKEDLAKAEQVISVLKKRTDDYFAHQRTPEGWHYLIRRIEAMADHVTEGALVIQSSLYKESTSTPEPEEKEEEEETAEEQEGMKPTTKKAIQSIIAGSIAIVVGYLISPIQPYWVVLTTFIVQLGTESVGKTYLKGLERSIGTVIGAVIGFGLAQLFSGQPAMEVILIFTFIFLAFYLFTVSYTIMSLFITLLIAFMYDLMLGGISYQLLGARVIDTIAGAAIALLVSAYIFPTRTMDKVSEALLDYLDELDEYVKAYLSSFQQKEEVKNLAEYGFTLDEKLQTIEAAAKPILQGPGGKKYSGLPERVTIFTAVNYYAKHLVASSYQKHVIDSGEIQELIEDVQQTFSYNIKALKEQIEQGTTEKGLQDMKELRIRIERIAAHPVEGQADLIHHLYYLWKMNESFLLLPENEKESSQ